MKEKGNYNFVWEDDYWRLEMELIMALAYNDGKTVKDIIENKIPALLNQTVNRIRTQGLIESTIEGQVTRGK